MSERKGHRRRESRETAATSNSTKLCPGPINHPLLDPSYIFTPLLQSWEKPTLFSMSKSHVDPRTQQTNIGRPPLSTLSCQIQNNIKAMLCIPLSKALLQPAPSLGDRQTSKLQPKTWEVLGRALVSHTQQPLLAGVWKLTPHTPNVSRSETATWWDKKASCFRTSKHS